MPRPRKYKRKKERISFERFEKRFSKNVGDRPCIIRKTIIRQDCEQLYDYFKSLRSYLKQKINNNLKYLLNFKKFSEFWQLRKNTNLFSFHFWANIKKLQKDIKENTLMSDKEYILTELKNTIILLLETRRFFKKNYIQHGFLREIASELLLFRNFCCTCFNVREDNWLVTKYIKFFEDYISSEEKK